ncbi:DUF952 domain-containing protein [Nocardia stercoris]|uniref:DUF952 domain-containing protein n=1 Tax=Nocardia stercoris TaxID=2483361 RepID=A0A3M2L6D1_9NOCA|nr:DUF952 domain-containing protein [Nocardia stercoris]RMI30088.1 DUF952 domain-containing protein [Nocardia stercoris]
MGTEPDASRDTRLLHICTDAEWAAAAATGEYRTADLSTTGFIHLSAPEQVALPANRLYAGRADLVLLWIDPAGLTAPVRWEPGVPGDPDAMLFPHLYGPLPVPAVIAVTAYRPGPDGRFTAPVAP